MMLHNPLHTLHKEENPALVQTTIRCTPDNAAQMKQVVKHWPELHSLVQSLQAQNLFPGLRALQITLTAGQDHIGKGLALLLPENASTAPNLPATTPQKGQPC